MFKFCFNHEIHKCSHPPTDFTALKPFLESMFHANLPSHPSLYYLDSDNNQVIISSDQDYQTLLNSNINCAKLFIFDSIESSNDQKKMENSPVIIHFKEDKEPDTPIIMKVEEEEEDEDDFELLSEPDLQKEQQTNLEESQEDRIEKEEDLNEISLESIIYETAESRVMTNVQNLYHIPAEQEAHLRQIVSQAIKQEMPYILSQIQTKLAKQEYVHKEIQCELLEVELKKVKVGLFEQIKDFGRKVKAQLKDLPDLAIYVLEDMSQMIDGDPNMLFAGGRYPQSVCAKAKKLKEIFPEVELLNLLNFVNKAPRYFSINQLAEVYITRNNPLEDKQLILKTETKTPETVMVE